MSALRRRWIVAVLVFAVVVIGARVGYWLRPPPQRVAQSSTGQVILVGGVGHSALTPADRAVLDEHATDAQVGAVSVRPRFRGDCAAAGWAGLGAGRSTTVGTLCSPEVQNLRLANWSETVAAVSARNGDAHLGTLAASVTGCVAAVGAGAAMAAARPDGTVAQFETVSDFLTRGARTSCPLTLVDAGARSDEIITELSKRTDLEVILTGIGAPGSSATAGLQVIYRLGSVPPGWLTSSSTRRTGVVTLADVTRTLIDLSRTQASRAGSTARPIDGAPLQVVPGHVSANAEQEHLDELAARPAAVMTGDLAVGIGAALLAVIGLAGAVFARFAVTRFVGAVLVTLPTATTLTGAVPWSRAGAPALVLCLVFAAWLAVLTPGVFALATALRVPVAVAGAALAVSVFTTDAALGGLLQRGSMLNPLSLDGGRWYGIGNVSFAAYATAGLVLAGYLAYRGRSVGHPRAGLVVAAAVGLVVILSDGWPSMGADFGGVVTLTPALIWLLFRLSDRPVRMRRLVLTTAAAVLAVSAISVLDWLRGPNSRTHLGNFVQRMIVGDAGPLLLRKGVAVAQSIGTLWGVVSIVLGILLWVVVFTRMLRVSNGFGTIRHVAVAVLMTAVVGSLLNDSGVIVWTIVTASFFITVASWWTDKALEAHCAPLIPGHDARDPAT